MILLLFLLLFPADLADFRRFELLISAYQHNLRAIFPFCFPLITKIIADRKIRGYDCIWTM